MTWLDLSCIYRHFSEPFSLWVSQNDNGSTHFRLKFFDLFFNQLDDTMFRQVNLVD